MKRADVADALNRRSGPETCRRSGRAFCVGLPKCGTHSVAEMLAGACRSAHEPEPEALLPLIEAARCGRLTVDELRSFFLARDRRLKLEFESSHLLGSFVPHLVDIFPDARFVVLVRDCRTWIDSMINDQLNLRAWEGYKAWQDAVYDQYLVRTKRMFPPEERILRDLDLYPISHYIRYWREEVKSIVGCVPRDRLLVLRTEELPSSVDRIARFVGVPVSGVDLDKSHSYRSSRTHNVLDAIDASHVCRLIKSAARSDG